MNYQIPQEYKPISAWGYFGYQLLYSIPLIGFIILIINAIGANNINVRNHARSYFCAFILGLVALIILIVLALVFGVKVDSSSFNFNV